MCVSQVYDGDNIHFPLVGTFCGTSIPSYFVSSGNFLTIHFVTDGSVQRHGFNATYVSVPCKSSSPFRQTASVSRFLTALVLPPDNSKEPEQTISRTQPRVQTSFSPGFSRVLTRLLNDLQIFSSSVSVTSLYQLKTVRVCHVLKHTTKVRNVNTHTQARAHASAFMMFVFGLSLV